MPEVVITPGVTQSSGQGKEKEKGKGKAGAGTAGGGAAASANLAFPGKQLTQPPCLSPYISPLTPIVTPLSFEYLLVQQWTHPHLG